MRGDEVMLTLPTDDERLKIWNDATDASARQWESIVWQWESTARRLQAEIDRLNDNARASLKHLGQGDAADPVFALGVFLIDLKAENERLKTELAEVCKEQT